MNYILDDNIQYAGGRVEVDGRWQVRVGIISSID